MDDHTGTKILTRDCEAIRIPSGDKFTLAKGTRVVVTQALGGSFTVATDQGLARITDTNADALGIAVAAKPAAAEETAGPAKVEEHAVWEQLRTCYDPEIPVNIVDLGLIYDCHLAPLAAGGYRVDVKMTLTAPGCGMGPMIAQDVQNKVLSLEGVEDVAVELVWDPPWNQAMMTEAAKLQLGLL